MKNRDSFFDVLKGLAIFLVVLGHSWQYLPEAQNISQEYLVLLMFHMPLFMAISGYFIYPSISRQSTGQYVKKRFWQLMPPSLTYGIITAGVVFIGRLYSGKEIEYIALTKQVGHGLWYLCLLFILCCVAAIVEKFIAHRSLKYLTWIIFAIAIQFAPNDLVLNGMKVLMPFAIGSVALRHRNWKDLPWWLMILSVCMFVFCLQKFTVNDTMYFMNVPPLELAFWQHTLLRLFAGCAGIMIVLYICKLLCKLDALGKYLSWVGRHTLPVYVLHIMFFFFFRYSHISIENIWLQTLFAIILLNACLYTYEKTCNYKLLSVLLYGEKKKA